MNTPIAHTTQVALPGVSQAVQSSIIPEVTEPFLSGRASSRLLFDFSVMASLLKQSILK